MPHPFVNRLLAEIDNEIEGAREGLERDMLEMTTVRLRGRLEALRECRAMVTTLDRSILGKERDEPASEDDDDEAGPDASYLP